MTDTKIRIGRNEGIILSGNKLSGNTFKENSYIKKYLDGKWDKNEKVWIVNEEKITELLNAKGSLVNYA